jgi:uncharacterized protein YdhG (YjbR/CyaY superfamily)
MAKPQTHDEVLASVSADHRAALQKLRKQIRAAAPQAEECISYGLPAFRLNGKHLVAYGAGKNHCSFFPMDSTTVKAFSMELKAYETSKGTIRFQPDKPLPAALVRKIVKARIAAMPGSQADSEVDEYMRRLKHPLKKELEAVRQLILGVSPKIAEGIKWKSPSFRTTDYFATVNVHGEDSLRVILHTGAKVKTGAGPKIEDPTGLLKWLGKDRAMVTLGESGDVKAKNKAMRAILRQWIKYV